MFAVARSPFFPKTLTACLVAGCILALGTNTSSANSLVDGALSDAAGKTTRLMGTHTLVGGTLGSLARLSLSITDASTKAEIPPLRIATGQRGAFNTRAFATSGTSSQQNTLPFFIRLGRRSRRRSSSSTARQAAHRTAASRRPKNWGGKPYHCLKPAH